MAIKEILLNTGVIENNEYLDKYIQLIGTGRQRGYVKYKTHKHHIIPKSYYKLKNLPVDNSSENIVYLLAAEHVLAHYYIAHCAINEDFRYRNILAFTFMTSKKYFNMEEQQLLESLPHFQKMYEEMCKQRGDNNRGRKQSEEVKARLKEINLKREYKQEWVEANRVAQKKLDRKHTEEDKLNQSNAIRGRRHVNNGVEEKLLKEADCLPYIEQGWCYGSLTKGKAKPLGFGAKISVAQRGVKKSETHKRRLSELKTGTIYINKNGITKALSISMQSELDHLLEDGWTLGTGYDYSHLTNNKDRSLKISTKNKNRIHINNGSISKMVRKEELEIYLQNGFVLGRLIGSKE